MSFKLITERSLFQITVNDILDSISKFNERNATKDEDNLDWDDIKEEFDNEFEFLSPFGEDRHKEIKDFLYSFESKGILCIPDEEDLINLLINLA